jgi:hypothetical protein
MVVKSIAASAGVRLSNPVEHSQRIKAIRLNGKDLAGDLVLL